MKNILTVSIIILMFNNICDAQDSSFSKVSVHAKNNIYKVKLGKRANFVENEKNHVMLQGFKSTSKVAIPPKSKDFGFDKSVISSIVYNTFSSMRVKQLASEKIELQILCITNAYGNVLEVSFSIPANASLKPSEIEKFEEKIKSDFKFNLNYDVFKNYNFYPLAIWIDFDKLYNKESNAIY